MLFVRAERSVVILVRSFITAVASWVRVGIGVEVVRVRRRKVRSDWRRYILQFFFVLSVEDMSEMRLGLMWLA